MKKQQPKGKQLGNRVEKYREFKIRNFVLYILKDIATTIMV